VVLERLRPLKPQQKRTIGGASRLRCEVKINVVTESLKKNALFSSLTAENFRQVREKVVIKNFKKNEIMLHEENTSDFMYIILEGEAKVVQTTEKGKEILISMHQKDDFFGELSLIDGKTAPATVYATKNSVIAIVSRADFFSLLYNQSKVLDNLLRILCARLRESMKKIQMLNFNNASQRIKMLFLLLSENYGEKNPAGTLLKLKLIHQDIADMTGLTRETVTRVLDKWQRSGEIQVLKDKCILLKPEFESISF
jgi:CRP/FNR family cyclic AMP-dependent transcriptional regulator